MYLQKVISRKTCQRHGSADPDPDPDPHQNVMDPQHCRKLCMIVYLAGVGKEDGPGVGEDDQPHASRHCEVINLVQAELKGAQA
jgi:hypothetical protein